MGILVNPAALSPFFSLPSVRTKEGKTKNCWIPLIGKTTKQSTRKTRPVFPKSQSTVARHGSKH